MERTAGLGHLSVDDWERLQEILDRFEKAWSNVASEDAIDLKAYLPGAEDPLRPVALQELIKADLEIRWRRGLTARIESYVNDFPDLKVVGTLAPLIYEEYRVRQMHGDKPPVTAYQDRFPSEYEELQRLVQEQPLPTVNHTNTPPGTSGAEEKPGEAAPQGTTLSPSLPRNVGGFKKIKRLGSGGFGEVWLGEAPGGVPCAIKAVFRPIEHEAAQREKQSLDLIKLLRHPFLLSTQQFYLEEDKLQIVMELADGSLRDRLKECAKAGMQGIPVGELIQYFREAAEALDYLHSEHVIHRDIKPDNILLLNRHAKVADFGLARFLENEQTASASGSGTPAYMAPEVWRRRVSEKSDQYSLAMSYVELRLDRPFSHDMMEVMLDHLERTPDLNPLPQPEQEVLKKALSKDPSNRYASCLEFLRALEQAVAPELGRTGAAAGMPFGGVGVAAGATGNDTMIQRGGTEGSAAADPYSSKTRVGDPTARRPVGWRDKGVAAASPAVSAPHQQRRKALKMMLMVLALPVVAVAAFAAFKPFVSSVKTDNGHSSKDSKEKDGKNGGSSKEKPSDIALPANCQNDTDDVSIIQGKKYYKHINYVFNDGTKIPFTLIPQNAAIEPPTFYIMVNKVSVKLFRKFANGGNKIENNKWEEWSKDKNPDVPIMDVSATDAFHFAVWLGGDLPSEHQWNKAAGLFEPNKGKGPFNDKAPIKEGDRLQFGLNRQPEEGPMPCGAATLDISEPFKLRDMAANGREWTRSVADFGNKRVGMPGLTTLDRVIVRGREYYREDPLTYEDMQDARKRESQGPSETRPITGFRVVIDNLP